MRIRSILLNGNLVNQPHTSITDFPNESITIVLEKHPSTKTFLRFTELCDKDFPLTGVIRIPINIPLITIFVIYIALVDVGLSTDFHLHLSSSNTNFSSIFPIKLKVFHLKSFFHNKIKYENVSSKHNCFN